MVQMRKSILIWVAYHRWSHNEVNEEATVEYLHIYVVYELNFRN